MLKIISAALVAGSMIVAPAMAATVIETAPVAKSETMKPSVANANAKVKAKKVRHHKAHKKTSAVVSKKHISSTAPVKHIAVQKKG
ncbi:MAG: hypothetical protein V4602_07640 [Pseudomonadota bacterium]